MILNKWVHLEIIHFPNISKIANIFKSKPSNMSFFLAKYLKKFLKLMQYSRYTLLTLVLEDLKLEDRPGIEKSILHCLYLSLLFFQHKFPPKK